MKNTQKKTPDHIVEAARKLAETAPSFGAETLAQAYRALGLKNSAN